MNTNNLSQESKWSTGLFNCCAYPATCFKTCCLPCITFGQIAEVVDEGQSSCVTQGFIYGVLMSVQFHWLYSCMFREKMRAKYGLPSDPCNDCCVHFFCESCALCQEHGELKNRGLNPSKGWVVPPHVAPKTPPTMERRAWTLDSL